MTRGSDLLHPLRALRRRIDAWALSRVQRQRGPVTVQRNRIYIVPTRFGWGFALMCVVMLLGAMNYSNSMAFALAFLLIGLVSIGPTLAILRWSRAVQADPAFQPSSAQRKGVTTALGVQGPVAGCAAGLRRRHGALAVLTETSLAAGHG